MHRLSTKTPAKHRVWDDLQLHKHSSDLMTVEASVISWSHCNLNSGTPQCKNGESFATLFISQTFLLRISAHDVRLALSFNEETTMKVLEKLATGAVSAAGVTNAAGYAIFGACWFFVALWLALPFNNIFSIVFGAILAGCGASCFVKAAEIYVSVRPAERPEERQRYLESHSLYWPIDRKEQRRRQRQED
jgi:hypothetical protein